jgi:hypothetical protein
MKIPAALPAGRKNIRFRCKAPKKNFASQMYADKVIRILKFAEFTEFKLFRR